MLVLANLAEKIERARGIETDRSAEFRSRLSGLPRGGRAELARLTGFGQGYIADICRDKRGLSTAFLEKIMELRTLQERKE